MQRIRSPKRVQSLAIWTTRLARFSSTSGALIETSSSAVEDSKDLLITENFITKHEETTIISELKFTFRRKYEYSHWDEAITGYRETEKDVWQERESQQVIERLKEVTKATGEGAMVEPLPHVHVLDLAPDGYIRPHIDSVKFCGGIIAGISMLSHCVMKLTHEDHKDQWITALLPRYSLYIMRGAVRYNYTHEILADKESYFKENHVPRDRRISVICRTHPTISKVQQ